MKLYPATFLLFFTISREVQYVISPNIAGVDLSSLSSYVPSLWGNADDKKNEPTASTTSATTEGGQQETLSWKQKFQNSLTSFLPNFPESVQVHILVAIKALFSNVPGVGFIIGTVIDEVISKYATSKSKDMILSTDTTDAMIFKLMSQKIDEKNLDEFLQIASDSRLVREVTSDLMSSLQKISDNFVAKYVENIKSKSK